MSLVGTGMKSSPGVAAKAFQTLGENDINIRGHLHVARSACPWSSMRPQAACRPSSACTPPSVWIPTSVFVETQLSAEEIAAKMKKGR